MALFCSITPSEYTPAQGGCKCLSPDNVLPISIPNGDAEEVLAMLDMAEKLNELVEKRVIALA